MKTTTTRLRSSPSPVLLFTSETARPLCTRTPQTTRIVGIFNTTPEGAGRGTHWMAYAIDLPSRHTRLRVTIYDPLQLKIDEISSNRVAQLAHRAAKQALQVQTDEAAAHGYPPPSPYRNLNVTSISAANGPKQQDSYSCGDMSLMYVNFVVSNPDKLDVGPKLPWPSSDVQPLFSRHSQCQEQSIDAEAALTVLIMIARLRGQTGDCTKNTGNVGRIDPAVQSPSPGRK